MLCAKLQFCDYSDLQSEHGFVWTRWARQETYSLLLRVIHVAERNRQRKVPNQRRLRNITHARARAGSRAPPKAHSVREPLTNRKATEICPGDTHIGIKSQCSPVRPDLLPAAFTQSGRTAPNQPACPERRRGLALMHDSLSLCSFNYHFRLWNGICTVTCVQVNHRCCRDIWNIIPAKSLSLSCYCYLPFIQPTKSVLLFIHASIYPSIAPSIHLSPIHPSVHTWKDGYVGGRCVVYVV